MSTGITQKRQCYKSDCVVLIRKWNVFHFPHSVISIEKKKLGHFQDVLFQEDLKTGLFLFQNICMPWDTRLCHSSVVLDSEIQPIDMMIPLPPLLFIFFILIILLL